MKRWLGSIATAMVVATSPWVEPDSTLAAQRGKSGPEIELEPDEHDFGGVEQNQNLEYEFLI